jgi:PAS domain S-box-containing protein
VEDECIVALAIQERLENLGYVVAGTTEYGEEAVALAGQVRPDIVLMDIRLRGPMDGLTAAEQIRSSYGLPVIYLTAYADDDTLHRAKGTDPYGYLIKPVQERELRTSIELALYKSQAEQRLRESERRYAVTLSSIQDGIVTTDHRGSIRYLNPAAERLIGRDLAASLGLPVARMVRLVHEASQLPLDCPLGRALRERTIVELAEAVLLNPDGKETPVEVRAAPFAEGEERAGGGVLVLRDVTLQRQLHKQQQLLDAKLQRAQKLQSLTVLAGGIAHDFNNILAGLVGYAELGLIQVASGADVRPSLEQIKAGAWRAAEITRQMLAYSGKGKFTETCIQLPRLLLEMSELIKVTVAPGSVLHYDLPDQLPAIAGDPSQIRQVVLNLLVNAVEAIGDTQGSITIRGGVQDYGRSALDRCELGEDLPAGRYVYLEVTDDGAGLAPEIRGRIFEPFFTTKFIGRGLGLPAVLGVMRGHAGAIEVESHPGKGSRFRLLFPPATEGETGSVKKE